MGRINKYIIGTSADQSDAEKQSVSIKKLFPGSFMVKVENGATSRIN
jgi:hypothetical protein